jgi:predicted metal-dependent hydrolase
MYKNGLDSTLIEKNKLTVGESVFFPIGGKGVKGSIIRKNKRTVTVLDTINSRVYRVPYPLLFKDITFSRRPLIFENSVLLTEEELGDLADEIRKEYQHIFNSFNSEQLDLLESVNIKWSKRTTYQKGGYYLKSKKGQLINEITISSSFKNAPKEVVKLVLYHEILHIKYFNHSKDFRSLEQSFSNFDKINEIMGKILVEFRIKSMKKE